MPETAYETVPIEGLRVSIRRGIVFIKQAGNAELNASSVYTDLSDKRLHEVRSRFDYWIDGNSQNSWFHGWPGHPDYNGCFVFKWKEQRQCQRFYGFLHHALPMSNPRFELCVLCSHAQKTEWETDPADLNGTLVLSKDPGVISAIRIRYPDSDPKGK